MNSIGRGLFGLRWTIALVAGAYALWAIGTLVFWVLGLAPSSPGWSVLLGLAGILATAGATSGLQRLDPIVMTDRIGAVVSAGFSGAMLGFYSAATISGDSPRWTTIGTIATLLVAGGTAAFAFRPSATDSHIAILLRIAIISVGGISAYGAAFGAAAWAMFAVSAGRWTLAIGLAVAAAIYLAMTLRSATLVHREANR